MSQKTALIMAGGTGGHIFPGLAVAEELRARGWRVHWLGAPGSMESRTVPKHGFALETIAFGGVRGKGVFTLALLPMRLLRAFWQALAVVRRVRPDVVVGLGGYISFPGGMMAILAGKPLVLHEQNSVAGMANRVMAGVADRVFTAFPQVFKTAQWVGNPLRTAFVQQGDPAARFAGRTQPVHSPAARTQFFSHGKAWEDVAAGAAGHDESSLLAHTRPPRMGCCAARIAGAMQRIFLRNKLLIRGLRASNASHSAALTRCRCLL